MLDEKIQKEIFEHLQKELMEIPFEEGHDLVQKKLCRKTEISDFLKLQTEKYEGQLKQVKKRLRLKLLPILKNQKERTEHKLFLGRRVDLRNIAAPSGAVFKKQQPGKNLDICVAVLVDNSFSMCGERMDHAILAALCLYDFCMESEIPVLVCGHHTDGYRHENLKDEKVYLHAAQILKRMKRIGSGLLVCSLMEATGMELHCGMLAAVFWNDRKSRNCCL